MTNLKKTIFALGIALTCGAYSSSAQIFVTVRPARPHYERAVAPSPRHVWVDEDWVERGGRYEWNGGRWVEPPHAGARWIPGHWKNGPRGQFWMPGHWR